jgi:hypothetical protein
MKKTLLASAITLVFAGTAWANPTNNNTTGGGNDQTATATSTQSGPGNHANENSTATQDNSDRSTSTSTRTATLTSNRTSTRTSTATNSRNRTDQDMSGYGNAAAANGSTATANFTNSFNSSRAIAVSRLSGTVSGNAISSIGNYATNNGAANGATGGAGGTNYVDAGTFNMSNAMTSVGQSAAGIMIANQNSGMASLVQQSVNVQANMQVGK